MELFIEIISGMGASIIFYGSVYLMTTKDNVI